MGISLTVAVRAPNQFPTTSWHGEQPWTGATR